MKKSMLFAHIIFYLSLLSPITSAAPNNALELQKQDTLKTLLIQSSGKNVTLKLGSGEELSGELNFVGQHIVKLHALKGREFFDAVIEIDSIHGIISRNR